MLRTIFAVVAFFAYLLGTWPALIRAKHFNNVGHGYYRLKIKNDLLLSEGVS